MRRVLVLIGNKVLVSEKDEVLIPFENMSDTTLAEELQLHYAVNTIRMDSFPEWNFYAVTAAPQKGLHCQLVSIASAIKKIDEHEYDIRNYLNLQRLKLSVKLQYGVRGGKIVHISDIPRDQNGLACNCTCPGCGMSLQARIGTKKQKHFAHNNESCDAASAQQTALHMLAKEIIEEEKRLFVPGVTVTKDEIYHLIDRELRNVFVPVSSWEYRPAITATCSSVLLEKRLSDIIPDIVIDVAGRTCLVEIAVTHFVDEEKRSKVKELGLPLFEIDLSSLYGGEITRDSIRNAVLHQTDNRRWIYNPIRDEARTWAVNEYSTVAKKTLDKQRKEQQIQLAKEKEDQQRRSFAQGKLERLFIPENYKQALLRLKDDDSVFAIAKSLNFFRKISEKEGIPFYLNIPITGEMIFKCDRRIWQSMLFDQFIYYRKSAGSTVSLANVESWIRNHQKVFLIDKSIAYKTSIEVSGKQYTLLLVRDVLTRYLKYISMLGFTSEFYWDEATVQHPHTLLPPNAKNASRLEAILHSVDITAPNINELVDQGLRPAITRWSPSRGTLSSAVEKIQLQGKIGIAERELCFEQIKDSDFEGEEPITDKIGFRWFLCTNCGNIFREDEMADYGGPNRVNKGLCQKCSKHC